MLNTLHVRRTDVAMSKEESVPTSQAGLYGAGPSGVVWYLYYSNASGYSHHGLRIIMSDGLN